MSTEEISATGRVVERGMICAFAGLCLTYRWNLFRVGVPNQPSGKLSAKGWASLPLARPASPKKIVDQGLPPPERHQEEFAGAERWIEGNRIQE